MSRVHVSKHEEQSWAIKKEFREKSEEDFRRLASGTSLPATEAGAKIREEYRALDRLQTKRAERILDYPYKGISSNVVKAMEEHEFSHEEKIALIKQLLRADLVKESLLGCEAQDTVCKKVLEVRAHQDIGNLSYVELKCLIGVNVFEVRSAGQESRKYMGELVGAQSKALNDFIEQTDAAVKASEYADTVAGYRKLYESGHHEAVGPYFKKMFTKEKIENMNPPRTSWVVFNDPKIARDTASAIGFMARRDPEYAAVAFRDQAEGLSEFASRTRNLAERALKQEQQEGRNIPASRKTRIEETIRDAQDIQEQIRPVLQGEDRKQGGSRSGLSLDLQADGVSVMKDNFRQFYYAHSAHPGAGKNILLAGLAGLRKEELELILSSAENFKRDEIFREGRFGTKEREVGLALFDAYQDTLRAAIAAQENLSPSVDPRLQADLSPEALAHTFLRDQSGFSAFIEKAGVSKE
ncbi:MAG: hypothetical protein GXY64_00660, partial [Bacteroidales bacterium]|nr:hypothetical protein [Bacteroidales bacterium]